jgi:hypothetical protein
MRLALLVVLLAGCLSFPTSLPDECYDYERFQTWSDFDASSHGKPGDREHDPDQPWQGVLVVRGDRQVGFDTGSAAAQWLSNGTQRMAILNLTEDTQLVPSWDGQTCTNRRAKEWELGPPRQGATAQPGQGALVYTAGFLDNGTLFYTNFESIHRKSEFEPSPWPRVDWYEYSGSDPLQVYVYDQDPAERPPHWGGSQRMFPVAVVDSPTEYFVTIRGFNEALKGLSTSATVVAHMSPEDAYTRPGNEDHPLYGEPLTFVIQISHVAELPCPHTTRLDGTCFSQ